MRSWVTGICIVRGMSRSYSQKTRPTINGSSAVRTSLLTSKTESTTTWLRAMNNGVNPQKTGTKSAAQYKLNVGAGKTATIRLRLSDKPPAAIGDPFSSFAATMKTRQGEADEFYRKVTPAQSQRG